MDPFLCYTLTSHNLCFSLLVIPCLTNQSDTLVMTCCSKRTKLGFKRHFFTVINIKESYYAIFFSAFFTILIFTTFPGESQRKFLFCNYSFSKFPLSLIFNLVPDTFIPTIILFLRGIVLSWLLGGNVGDLAMLMLMNWWW